MPLYNREKEARISSAFVRETFSYDAATGFLAWRKSVRGRPPGIVAGTRRKDGRVIIIIGNVPYLAHRLVWLYVHGHWPADQIDHANGDPSDNRIANLREATASQNLANRAPQKHRPRKGITFDWRNQKWQAQIKWNGKNLYLGLYEDPDEAARVYAAKAKEFYGEFAWVK